MSSTTSNTPKEFNNIMSAFAGAIGTFAPYKALTCAFGLPFAISVYDASSAQFVCGGVSLAIGVIAAVTYRRWISQEEYSDVLEERTQA